MIDSISILQLGPGGSLRMTLDELEELLLDLQHDLGKHIAMPLAFVPASASPAERHQALRRALLETRRAGARVQPARALWQVFVDQAGSQLAALATYASLQQVVARALGWEHVARASDPDFDHTRALADLRAVAPAIRALLEELHAQPT